MNHYISHRNYNTIRLFVTGMGAAVILPWFVLTGRSWATLPAILPKFSGDGLRFARVADAPALLLFVGIWLVMMLFLRLFDWVNEWLNDDTGDQLVWRTVIVVLMIVLVLPLNRLLLYRPAFAPIFDPARGIFHALFNFTDGWRPENSLIFFYLAGWLFVIWVTSNALGYFEIGRAFRVGLVISLAALLLLARRGESRFLLFVPFIGCSLTALALSHLDSRIAMGHHSQGARFSRGAWGQFVGTVVGLILIGTLIADALLPAQLRAALAVFDPVFQVILLALGWVGRLLLRIIQPVFIFLFTLIENLIRSLNIALPGANTGAEVGGEELTEIPTLGEMILAPSFRYVFVGFIAFFFLLIVWIVLNRTILKRYRDEPEEAFEEQFPEDFDLVGDGVSRLRSWFDRLRGRRHKPLLAPDKIEDMYANISRLADRRGFPRGVSQPPDQYLADLEGAFPGQQGNLAQLTGGYMRSHYGEVMLPSAEMVELKRAYLEIVTTKTETDETKPASQNNEDL